MRAKMNPNPAIRNVVAADALIHKTARDHDRQEFRVESPGKDRTRVPGKDRSRVGGSHRILDAFARRPELCPPFFVGTPCFSFLRVPCASTTPAGVRHGLVLDSSRLGSRFRAQLGGVRRRALTWGHSSLIRRRLPFESHQLCAALVVFKIERYKRALLPTNSAMQKRQRSAYRGIVNLEESIPNLDLPDWHDASEHVDRWTSDADSHATSVR